MCFESTCKKGTKANPGSTDHSEYLPALKLHVQSIQSQLCVRRLVPIWQEAELAQRVTVTSAASCLRRVGDDQSIRTKTQKTVNEAA